MPSPPPDLIDALKSGRAIAIVGSGLSSQVGGPSWKDLLYGLVAEACETRPEEAERIKAAFLEIAENRFLNGAGLLKEVLGTSFIKAVVRQIEFKRELQPRKEIKEAESILDALFEICERREKRDLIPSISHRMLTQLPFRAIITTNYDRLLEKAAPAEKISSTFTRSYPYLPKRVLDGKWFLLKIHGCVDTPEDIILSRDDYQKALFSEPLHEVLESLFKTNEKFWIGYGHNDPTLDFLVDECREKLNLNSGFAVAQKTNFVLERRFTTAGIQPSWLDDYLQVPGYLRQLAEATDCPLIFEITIKCEWAGERNAESYGKRIAEAFSQLGGDFELFRVETGSIRLYLETKASTLTNFHNRLKEGDTELLKIIRTFNIASFDGLNIDNSNYNGITDNVDSSTSIQADTFEYKHQLPIPHQIPSSPPDFKGREDEITDILSNFDKGATINGLRGMAGVGKTALAFVLAERLKSSYPEGQILINLQGTSKNPLSSAEAMAQVIHAYLPGIRVPDNESELRGLYLSVLSSKRILLLLDNAANKAQVEPLLPPIGCAVLITSRNKFTLPGLKEKDLDVLPPDNAAELLLEIAPRIGNRAKDLANICGYLPLALRNAGCALAERKDLSVIEYEWLLKDKKKRLELVEASFSLSYDLLTPTRRKHWCRLSVFPEDFDRNGATAILKIAPGPSVEVLSDLVRWSLIDFLPSGDSENGRYKLHDLARLFTELRLDPDESLDAKYRHAKHYLKVVSEASRVYIGHPLEGLKLFDREYSNIIAGQLWVEDIVQNAKRLRKKSQLNLVLQMAVSYAHDAALILDLRLHPQSCIRWHETALTASQFVKNRNVESVHLNNLGNAYSNLGEPRKAIEYYEQALKTSRKTGNRQGEGVGLGNLGNAYFDLGEPRKAIEYHEQALKISREIGDRRGEGVDLGNLGNAYSYLSEPRRAIDYYEQALKISREVGDRRNEGTWMGDLGLAYSHLGEPRRAIDYYEQALKISREIGDRRGEGADLSNLGNAYSHLGEPRKAIGYYQQALKISREIGDRRGEGADMTNIGLVYSDIGKPHEAIDYYEQALKISREIGDRRGEEADLSNLGNAYSHLGEPRKAIEYHEQALKISRKSGNRKSEGADLGNLGNAYFDLGEPRKAIEYHEQALKISREIGDRRGEEADLSNLGNAYSHLGEPRKAIEYHEQALKISREIGDRRGEGVDLSNLGDDFSDLGETCKAIDYYEQALAISREIGDVTLESEIFGYFGKAYADLGEFARAISYCEQSLKIVQKIYGPKIECEALCNLGRALVGLDDIPSAIKYLDQSLEIARKTEYRRVEGEALFNMSLALDKLSQRQEAIEHAKVALTIFEQIESHYAEAVRQKLADWQA